MHAFGRQSMHLSVSTRVYPSAHASVRQGMHSAVGRKRRPHLLLLMGVHWISRNRPWVPSFCRRAISYTRRACRLRSKFIVENLVYILQPPLDDDIRGGRRFMGAAVTNDDQELSESLLDLG
nr:hypothetical protein CFP56_09526 [Quercus suber]